MLNIIYSASGGLTLLLMVLLLTKKQKTLAEYLLAAWFLLILLVIVTTYINHNQIDTWQGLFELTDSSAVLFGPFMWFYTLALTKEEFRFYRKDGWHLLPFIAISVYLFFHLFRGENVSEAGLMIILVAKMMILISYGLATLLRLNKHEKRIAGIFSYTEKVQLNWLKLLVWSLIGIWVISAVSLLLYSLAEIAIPQYGGLFTNLALSIFMLVLGYFGIRQTTIFIPAHLLEATGNLQVDLKTTTGISSGTQRSAGPGQPRESTVSDKDYQRLIQLMEREKPFLDGQLTLYKLAHIIQRPAYQVSQIINRHAGTNFFDYINQYQVEEVKIKIREKAHIHQTLLAIALDCGFNSKASFNRVFKKMTGQTPKEFITTLK